ncbi:MAG: hypothetical protein ACXVAX_01115 [Pseudobdellovibrio sp.]
MNQLSPFKTSVIFIILAAHSAFAGGINTDVLKDESISDGKIIDNFNLRADSGKVLSFLNAATQDDQHLNLLPPEKDADQSLCGKQNIDWYLKLTNIMIRFSDNAVAGKHITLNPDEVLLIQKTPRCDPNLDTLKLISNFLAIGTEPSPEKISKVSLVPATKGYAIELVMESGEKAHFAIAGLPSQVRNINDLTQMNVSSDSSNQNLSLKIRFASDSPDNFPSQNNRTESCLITYQQQVCEQDGRCRIQTVTETGYRYVSSTTTFDMTNYSLELVDKNNNVVYSGTISDGQFDSSPDSSSACYRY